MNRVAVVTSHLSNGDAVSNDVVGMSRAIEGRGLDSRIFSGSSDLTGIEVHSIRKIKEFLTDQTDLLIYHYSIGWNQGLELLRAVECRTAIKYHNVTPPEFFIGVSPWHEERCRAGRVELREIVRAECDIYLADSEYNRADLLLEGVAEEKVSVVPPFHHVDRLEALEADLQVLDRYRDGRANILMVGRVAPHKGHPFLIEAFADYHRNHNPESRLFIVGKEEDAFRPYSERLREIVSIMLPDEEESVCFIGEASDSELKAYYLLSSLFAIASEHEGFCVPVIEAMSMKVPVVAYASSAIPATVGRAGLILKEHNPRLMAATFDRLIRDETLNVSFGMKGWQRYEQNFTNEKIELELFKALSRIAN
ncbi:MAG TPA: glycosyltransferase family 4 protein [Pyrinomonadaceae bacterium]|nr:glycosyltransferase family 4 protein [Pyrinomonadaceae bacterium]